MNNKMKNIVLSLCLLLISITVLGQSYNMPYRGRTTVTGCNLNVYDNGGVNGNYSGGSQDTITIVSNDLLNPYVEVLLQEGCAISASDTVYIYNAGTADPAYLVQMGSLNVYWWNETNTIILGSWSFRANSLNPDNGAITIVLHSAPGSTNSGLVVETSCHEACQPVNSLIDKLSSDPALKFEDDGYYYMDLCPGQVGTIKAADASQCYTDNGHMYTQSHATSTFRWYVGDDAPVGGVGDSVYSAVFPTGRGVDVRLELNDYKNCPPTVIDYIRVRVSANPIKNVNLLSDICKGTEVDPIVIGYDSTSFIMLDTVSNSAQSSLKFDSLLHLPDGPNCPGVENCYNATVYFTDFEAGAVVTSVNDIISVCLTIEHSYLGDITMDLICPNGHSARLESQNGGGIYLGLANDPGTEDVCNPVISNTGTGWNYCFSENTALGFTYGPSNGYLYQGNLNGSSIDSTNRVNNTNYYHPVNSFSSLIGCPLNGAWSIQVCDLYGIDDGWIWEWELNLDPSLIPQPWDYSVTVDSIIYTGANLVQDPDNPSVATVQTDSAGDFNYYFAVIDNFGCVYDSLFTLSVVEMPTPDLGDDTFFCINTTIDLDPHYTYPGATYSWSSGQTTNTIAVNSSGTYSITVKVDNADHSLHCVKSDTITVGYYPEQHAIFTSTKTQSCSPLDFILHDQSTPSDQTYEYFWLILNANNDTVQYSEAASPSFSLTEPGDYSVYLRITSPNGCVADTTYHNYLHVWAQPIVNYSVTYVENEVVPVPDNDEVLAAMFLGTAFDFENLSIFDPNDNTNSWLWDFGDGNTSNELEPHEYQYADWGQYTVTLSVVNEHGCSSSVTYIISVEAPLEFTNVLTPNNDGKNDIFAIKNLDPSYPNDLNIYDRWGKRVFHAENYQTYMKDDGVVYNPETGFNPEKFSDGVYYYTFTYYSNIKTSKYHGSITVIRSK